MRFKGNLANYIPGIVLFILALIVGLCIYQDYGISWDEQIQRDLGLVSYNYVFHGDHTLMTYPDKALGTGFELPLILFEKLLRLKDPRDIYLMRHLVTHIFFLLSAFCGYLLALRLFKDQFIACLGFILFTCCPRIYAHSFFNSKDIPFLSACLIALLVCQVAFEKNKRGWYLLLGTVCGYATSIRAMGVCLLPCIMLFFLIDFFNKGAVKEKPGDSVFKVIFFCIGFCGMLFLSWPFLWSAPYHNFTTSFHSLANMYTGGCVLFKGVYVSDEKLPLDYMPVWFSITIPELWLVSGLAGFVWIIIACVKAPLKFLLNTPERNFILYISCFAGPVVAMVVLNGVNIDDWRHLYFIYPSFVMMILFVVNRLARGRKKIIVQLACAVQIMFTVFFMIRNHPYQQVYFNSFVSHSKEYLRKNFELEYWGCSFKQGLEYLVATDKSDSIKIDWAIQPLFNNILMLHEQDRKRIYVIDDRNKANYLITNYRRNNHADDPPYKIYYSIPVENSTIMCIYNLKH